jgi:acyl-CoA thioester hydrolase
MQKEGVDGRDKRGHDDVERLPRNAARMGIGSPFAGRTDRAYVAMTQRPSPDARSTYRHFTVISTRWMDNDVYGHVNNVQYYSFFDTAVNGYLIAQGVLDPATSPVIGLVVETQCRYFESLSFPEAVHAGIRVAKMGTSSVRYEIGLFREGATNAVAQGYFVHVYVGRDTRRPVPLPAPLKDALARLMEV